MSEHHRTRMLEALVALELRPDGTHSWFGQSMPTAGTSVKPASSRGDVEAFQRHEVQITLYADFYGRGRAVRANAVDVFPDPTSTATFTAALQCANHGTGGRDPGWRVRAVHQDALVIEKGVLAIRVQPDEFTVAGGPAVPGAEGDLRLPNALDARSPGYHMVLGNSTLPNDAVLTRVYFNLTPEGAITATDRITRHLNDTGVAFMFKTLSDTAAYTRCDAAVLYVHRRDESHAIDFARQFARAAGRGIKPAEPAMTFRITPGIGLAHDPGDGESFGLHRCGLLADAAVAAWRRGRPMRARLVAALESAFGAAGLSVDHPYAAAGLAHVGRS